MNSENMFPPFSDASVSVGLIPREDYSEEVKDARRCATTSTTEQSTDITSFLLDMPIVVPMLFILRDLIAGVFRWRYKSDYFDQKIRGYDYLTDHLGRTTLFLGANKVLIGKYIRCSLTFRVTPPDDPSSIVEYYSPYKFLTGYPRENFKLENPMFFQVTREHIDETGYWIKLNLIPVKAKQSALLRKVKGSKKKCPTLRRYPSGDKQTFPGVKPRQLWNHLRLDTMHLVIQAGELDEHGSFIVDSSILTTYIGPITGCDDATKKNYFQQQQQSNTVVPSNHPSLNDHGNYNIVDLFDNAEPQSFDTITVSEPKIGVSTTEYNYANNQRVQQPCSSNAKRTITYLDQPNEPPATKMMKKNSDVVID